MRPKASNDILIARLRWSQDPWLEDFLANASFGRANLSTVLTHIRQTGDSKGKMYELNWRYLILSFLHEIQSLSCVQLFVTPWTAARQASLSFTISWSLLKVMSI